MTWPQTKYDCEWVKLDLGCMASLEFVESPQTATATAMATRNDIDNERVQMENGMEMVEEEARAGAPALFLVGIT